MVVTWSNQRSTVLDSQENDGLREARLFRNRDFCWKHLWFMCESIICKANDDGRREVGFIGKVSLMIYDAAIGPQQMTRVR
jgi:hypothetical protein